MKYNSLNLLWALGVVVFSAGRGWPHALQVCCDSTIFSCFEKNYYPYVLDWGLNPALFICFCSMENGCSIENGFIFGDVLNWLPDSQNLARKAIIVDTSTSTKLLTRVLPSRSIKKFPAFTPFLDCNIFFSFKNVLPLSFSANYLFNFIVHGLYGQLFCRKIPNW